ncbi:MAG TPA: hypothetical protein VFH95_04710 [Candidatus Kapabacteria bacterium]|nr:hypothetical protein [Candidatus Kapabacteria bacterium]
MANIWHALADEAGIAVEHLAIGVTAIGKANYAKQAYYAQAFFALSVGFERSAKLALIIDHALMHNGEFPSFQEVKDWGHGLKNLLQKVDDLSIRRAIGKQLKRNEIWARLPQTQIHKNMIDVLDEFATNITRYYNIDFVTGLTRAQSIDSPSAAWYNLVTSEILKTHYSGKQRNRDEQTATLFVEPFGSLAYIMSFSEHGDEITAKQAAIALAHSKFAAPFARLYLLQIMRFLTMVMNDLNHQAYKDQNENIPDLGDFYGMFNNKDKYLKRWKTWSLYDK